MKKKTIKERPVRRRTDPHHLCFQIGSRYYLMNLMEGKVEDGSILGKFMKMVDADMKRNMRIRPGAFVSG